MESSSHIDETEMVDADILKEERMNTSETSENAASSDLKTKRRSQRQEEFGQQVWGPSKSPGADAASTPVGSPTTAYLPKRRSTAVEVQMFSQEAAKPSMDTSRSKNSW